MQELFNNFTKYNYWNEFPEDLGYLRESYLNRISSSLGNKLIKVFMGQRRSGKSYILRQAIALLIKKGTNPKNIFYLNKEQVEFDDVNNYKILLKLFESYKSKIKPKGKIYIFIDEIQEIEGWEKFINSFANNPKINCELLITGSNSKMLSSELSTLLSGRYLPFYIYPFSYAEYRSHLSLGGNRESLISYLNNGGLPEMFNLKTEEEKKHYIMALRDSIILNDIVKRFEIKNVTLLEKIFAFTNDNIGKLTSLNKLVKTLNSMNIPANYETLSKYIAYLSHSFMIHECERYDIKGKKILAGERKYYLNDLAFKVLLSSSFEPDLSKRLENLVYLHFKSKGYSVYVGNHYNLEVDFIIEKENIKEYIQVCYTLNDEKTIEREYRSLEKIGDNYKKCVVSMDDISLGNRNGIEHYPVWEII